MLQCPLGLPFVLYLLAGRQPQSQMVDTVFMAFLELLRSSEGHFLTGHRSVGFKVPTRVFVQEVVVVGRGPGRSPLLYLEGTPR